MRRNTLNRIYELRTLAAFAGCTDDELEKIDMCGAHVTLGTNRMVLRQGAVPRECFVIRKGWVEVVDGDRQVALRGPGSWIGEMALVDRTVRCATARSLTPVELLTFDAGELFWLLRNVPNLAASIRGSVGIRRQENAVAMVSERAERGLRVWEPRLSFG
jgi:CRP/FNR family transcriptional regulator, cyclic AMP receptor protein